MINQRPIVKTLFFSIVISTLIAAGNSSYAQDVAAGKALFQSNCATCHNPIKILTGPALKGVRGRVPNNQLLHDWIHNNQKVLATGNPYFTSLYIQYSKYPMTVFTSLTDKEIDDILAYVEGYEAPKTDSGDPRTAPGPCSPS